MQRQLQWRGMGSKLEKGLEGKKNEIFGAQISVIRHQVSESHTHFSHLLLPFLFLFSSCLYRFETSLPCQRSMSEKQKKKDTGVSRVLQVSVSNTRRTPVLCQKWLVNATQPFVQYHPVKIHLTKQTLYIIELSSQISVVTGKLLGTLRVP